MCWWMTIEQQVNNFSTLLPLQLEKENKDLSYCHPTTPPYEYVLIKLSQPDRNVYCC